jgi:isoleucyl-tRNA synthetase
MLVFTMEDVWLSRFPDSKGSVHLEDIPETPASWRNEALATKWDAVRRARRVVTAALEIERTNKVIGASLEAAPEVFIEDAKLLETLQSVPFEDICITSSLALNSGQGGAFHVAEVAGIGVTFKHAPGEKCVRCWKILPDVGSHAHPGLCARCDEAVSQD